MERNGFNASPHETSGKTPDASSEKEPGKKKKSKGPEASVESVKKEQIAERTKSLLDRLVHPEENKSDAVEKVWRPDKEAENISPEAKTAEPAPAEADDSEERADADVETLTPEEQAEVVMAYATARVEELKAGRSETEDAADAVAREANIQELENVVAQYEEATTEQLNTPAIESDVPLAEAETPDEPAAPEEEVREFADEDDIPLGGPTPTSTSSRPVTPPPSSGAASAAAPPLAGGTTRGRGGAGLPPIPPIPPYAAGGGPSGAPNHNTTPSAASRPNTYVPDYRQNPNATYLLVGGIVGYFIGRRRGRIKTEKRMKVVQRKLEKQVADIQNQVVEKELAVQKLAREQYWERKRNETAKPEKSRPAAEPATERQKIPSPERPPIAPQERAVSSRPERAETASTQSQSRETLRPQPRQLPELTKAQLLETGEKIKVGNTNLKRIYEAKLINESGFRRLVHEHLENRDIRRGLAREFLAKELSYERDPHFRDLDPLEESQPTRSAGTANVASVTNNTSDMDDGSAVTKPPASKPVQKAASKRTSTQVSNGILAALTLLALGLAVYAVLLGMSR